MPVVAFVPVQGFFWTPPIYTTLYKLEVVRADGTIDDITNLVHACEIEDGVTETIGRFEFEIWDPNETYVKAWTGNEVFRYYADYAVTATTKRFQGRIEKVSKQGMKIKCTGRSETLFYMDITVTQSFANTACNTILTSLVSTYSTGFTVTNVQTSTENLTVNWYQKPFWECVKELCTAANFDAYIDSNKDWHFFPSGSINNATEGIVMGINMVEVGEFADDLTQIRNRIIVYGADTDGIQNIYTAEDTDSQTRYGVKEEIINEGNATSYQQAKDLGDFRLSELKNPPRIGEIKGILLASIQPGERIPLSSQADGIDPKYYNIISYKHDLINYTTTVKIFKEPRQISHIFKDIIERQSKTQNTSINPAEMRQSYNFLFNSDSGTHTSTQITNGVLKLSSGSSGNWISPTRTTISNITSVYLIAIGETLTGASYEVSGDGGTNFQSITPETKTSLSTIGTGLVVKVTFTNADTQIDSLSILFR